MSQTQHTPGPWRIGDARHTIFEAIGVGMVAQKIKPENARLIAAAPELLDGLTLAVDFLSNMGLNDRDLSNLRSIIAKAEGGE